MLTHRLRFVAFSLAAMLVSTNAHAVMRRMPGGIMDGDLYVGRGSCNDTITSGGICAQGASEFNGTLRLDGALAANSTFTFTGTAGETFTLNRTFTDATAENGMVVNITALDTTSGTAAQYGLLVNNAASTEAADGALVVKNTDADDAVGAGLLFDAGGAGTDFVYGVDLDAANVTTDIRFENADTLDNQTDAQFMFGRDTAGTVTITAKDNDAAAALDVLPGGAAALGLGGASTTAVTVTTDGTGTAEVALPAGSIDSTEILDGTVAHADLAAALVKVCSPSLDFAAVTSPEASVLTAQTCAGVAAGWTCSIAPNDGGLPANADTLVGFGDGAGTVTAILGSFAGNIAEPAAETYNLRCWAP